MRKDATKIRSSISPGALINTINVVTILGFLWLVQRRGLASCNISILWNRYSVDWCVCLTSILYFTCLTSICGFFFLFHWSLPVPIPISYLVEILNLYYFVDFFNACDDSPVRQLSCTDHLHDYNRLLKILMILFIKYTSPFLTKYITYITNELIVLLEILFY